MTKRSKRQSLYSEETEGGEKLCYLEKSNIEIIDIDDSNALHLFAPIYVLSLKGLYTSFFYVTLVVDKDLTLRPIHMVMVPIWIEVVIPSHLNPFH